MQYKRNNGHKIANLGHIWGGGDEGGRIQFKR